MWLAVTKINPVFHPNWVERFRQTISYHKRSASRSVPIDTSNGTRYWRADIYEGETGFANFFFFVFFFCGYKLPEDSGLELRHGASTSSINGFSQTILVASFMPRVGYRGTYTQEPGISDQQYLYRINQLVPNTIRRHHPNPIPSSLMGTTFEGLRHGLRSFVPRSSENGRRAIVRSV